MGAAESLAHDTDDGSSSSDSLSCDSPTTHRFGPLTEAKQKFDRAARRARLLELDAYSAAEDRLDGITKDEAIRQIRFHSRHDKLLQARAEIYALNEIMRERERHQFEEYFRSVSWWRSWASQSDWSVLAPPERSEPLVDSPKHASLPPFDSYRRALDAAQREYERATNVRGSGSNARAQYERERELGLMPTDLAHQLQVDRVLEAKERAREQQLAREAGHDDARERAFAARHGLPLGGRGKQRALAMTERRDGQREMLPVGRRAGGRPGTARSGLGTARPAPDMQSNGKSAQQQPLQPQQPQQPPQVSQLSQPPQLSQRSQPSQPSHHREEQPRSPYEASSSARQALVSLDGVYRTLYTPEKPPKSWVSPLSVHGMVPNPRERRLGKPPRESVQQESLGLGTWAADMWQRAGEWASARLPASGQRHGQRSKRPAQPWGTTRMSDLVTQARARRESSTQLQLWKDARGELES